jgi:hypothetical protein
MVVKRGKPIGYRISNECNNSFLETPRCRRTSVSLYLSCMSPFKQRSMIGRVGNAYVSFWGLID